MRNIDKKRKKEILFFIVSMAIIIITTTCFSYFMTYQKEKNFILDHNENMKILCSIESIICNRDEIILDGWAFENRLDTSDFDIQIIARNIKNNEDVWFTTDKKTRGDVDRKFDGFGKYMESGFSGRTQSNNIDINNIYEVLVSLKNHNSYPEEQIVISSKQYIYQGKLFDYNPADYNQPIFLASSNISDIPKNGKLCYYSNSLGIYVFIHNRDLVMIASEKYKFNESEETYISIQTYTNQTEKLQESQRKAGFEYHSTMFEWAEYTAGDTSPYRVAIIKLPEYVITHIKLGQYERENKQWIWKAEIKTY